jgi:HAMP domain-containing protein
MREEATRREVYRSDVLTALARLRRYASFLSSLTGAAAIVLLMSTAHTQVRRILRHQDAAGVPEHHSRAEQGIGTAAAVTGAAGRRSIGVVHIAHIDLDTHFLLVHPSTAYTHVVSILLMTRSRAQRDLDRPFDHQSSGVRL